MKKYWDLFKEISRLTDLGELHWREVDKLSPLPQVSKPWEVTRQFRTPFGFNGSSATLVCIERPIFVDEDYLFPFEDVTCELIVLKGETVLEKIADPTIPWYWLGGFAALVSNLSKRVAIPQHA